MKKTILLLTLLLSLNTAFASFTGSSLIETESGENEIKLLNQGDSVVTLMKGSTSDNMNYDLHAMDFVSSGEARMMVFIQYGDKTLIVSPEQPMFLSNHKFIRASDLIPGVHQLLSSSGQAINIDSIRVGEYSGRIYSMANSDMDNVYGNTLVVDKIIVGSFAIEIAMQ